MQPNLDRLRRTGYKEHWELVEMKAGQRPGHQVETKEGGGGCFRVELVSMEKEIQ